MKLKVILNGGDSLPLVLGQGYTIGRESGNLTIPQDRKLSRRHCSIWEYPELYFIVDHESKNGTYMNGRRLVPNTMVPMKDGDVVRLGSQHISVRNIELPRNTLQAKSAALLAKHFPQIPALFDRKHLDKLGYVLSALFVVVGLGFKLNHFYLEHKIASNPNAVFNRELRATRAWTPEFKSKLVGHFIERSNHDLEFADLDLTARQRFFSCYADGISSQYDSPSHFADELRAHFDDTNKILQQIGSACVSAQHLNAQEDDVVAPEDQRSPAANGEDAPATDSKI
jgi:pSer/pThr/pTyr-binding forkhead associated (FHA) protein